jgi:hypothetical protein
MRLLSSHIVAAAPNRFQAGFSRASRYPQSTPRLACRGTNLNCLPTPPYNSGMPTRPQFSLRMLLFAVVMVCLAAATVSPLPAGQRVAAHCQTLFRAMLCVTFPAMLARGSIHARGYLRSFLLGGLFPAAAALLIVSIGMAGEWRVTSYDTPEMLNLWRTTQAHSSFIAGLWAFMPISGLLCVCFHWLFQRGESK